MRLYLILPAFEMKLVNIGEAKRIWYEYLEGYLRTFSTGKAVFLKGIYSEIIRHIQSLEDHGH